MSLDTRFASAIHFLILISESPTPMSSSQIAQSIGTNPSYIRKLASSLKKNGLIQSHKGISGFSLLKSPNRITLWDIAKPQWKSNGFISLRFIKIPMIPVW